MTEKYDPPGAVYISTREIYDEVKATRSDVHRLIQTIQEQKADITDHEARLREVERKVWMASGIAALISGGGATIIQMFLTKGA